MHFLDLQPKKNVGKVEKLKKNCCSPAAEQKWLIQIQIQFDRTNLFQSEIFPSQITIDGKGQQNVGKKKKYSSIVGLISMAKYG